MVYKYSLPNPFYFFYEAYLRSTMSQPRLSGLAVLSIDKEFTNNINFEKVIDEFAAEKARKMYI